MHIYIKTPTLISHIYFHKYYNKAHEKSEVRELRLEQNRRFGYDYLNTTNSVISQETEKEEKEKTTENTEAHSWIFQEEMYKDENIWKWKAQAQFNCLTVNCGISPVQEQPGRLHMCMQLSLHKRKTMNRFVGVFFPSLSILPAVQHS